MPVSCRPYVMVNCKSCQHTRTRHVKQAAGMVSQHAPYVCGRHSFGRSADPRRRSPASAATRSTPSYTRHRLLEHSRSTLSQRECAVLGSLRTPEPVCCTRRTPSSSRMETRGSAGRCAFAPSRTIYRRPRMAERQKGGTLGLRARSPAQSASTPPPGAGAQGSAAVLRKRPSQAHPPGRWQPPRALPRRAVSLSRDNKKTKSKPSGPPPRFGSSVLVTS